MYAAAEKSKQKGLKIAAGTQRRHAPVYRETIKRIQDGAIGDVTALRAYWVNGGPIWHRGDKGDTDLERQIHNWYHYIWLCGDHIWSSTSTILVSATGSWAAARQGGAWARA
jgi:predicted dehydrogenase